MKMSLIDKIKLLLKINSEYNKVVNSIKEVNKMSGTKKWYLSKTIWGIIISSAVSIVQAIDPSLLQTPVAVAIIAVASAFGIYGRVDAKSEIK